VLKRQAERKAAPGKKTLETLFAYRNGGEDEVDLALMAGLGFKLPGQEDGDEGASKGKRKPIVEFLLDRSRLWRRELVRHPWCMPVVAMHAASLAIQTAWRRSWLRIFKPSSNLTLPTTYQDIQEHAAITSPTREHLAHPKPTSPSRLSKPGSSRRGSSTARPRSHRRASTSARAATQLRQRHMLLLQHQAEAALVALHGGMQPARGYETFDNFCAALIQGFFRSFRKLKLARWIQRCSRFKVYQVAAYEIQISWKQHRARPGSETHQLATLALSARKSQMAARSIQRAWKGAVDYRAYKTLKDTIAGFRGIGDPYLLLRTVLPREAMLLDPAMQVHVRFRLGGVRFPPTIYYKVFTHGKVCDVGAFAPRDYAQERYVGKGNAPDGWYARWENNGWRALAARLVPGKERALDEVERESAAKAIPYFHHSRLKRKQDVELKRRQRTIQWMRKLYGLAEDVTKQEDTMNAIHDYGIYDDTQIPKLPQAASDPMQARNQTSPMARGQQQQVDEGTPRQPYLQVPKPPQGPKPTGRPLRNLPSRGSTSSSVDTNATADSVEGQSLPQPGQAAVPKLTLPLERRQSDTATMDMLDDEEDDLVQWSQRLDFESYMNSWQVVATSDVSEGTLPISEPYNRFAKGLIY